MREKQSVAKERGECPYKVGQIVLVEVKITDVRWSFDQYYVQLAPFVGGMSAVSAELVRRVDRTDTQMTSTAQRIRQLQSDAEDIQRRIAALKEE